MDTILFSGGGMRGIAYAGAFKYLRKHFCENQIRRVCGVSIGSAFSLFWILGYTYKELTEEIRKKDFRYLADPKISNLIGGWGLDNGKGLKEWLETFLLKRGLDKGITFRELWGKIQIELGIVATNLNKSELEMFSKDTTPDLSVIEAAMRSMRIPFLFTAKGSGKEENPSIYVDGAVLSNLPINFCKKCFNIEESHLLAIRLVNKGEIGEIGDITSFITAIGRCMSKVVGGEKCEHLLEIDISDLPHLDFKMSRETKNKLIKCGIKDTKKFMDEFKI